MKLTKEQIADLESRGIKPGVKVIDAFLQNEEFVVLEWSKYRSHDDRSIFSKLIELKLNELGEYLNTQWLYDNETGIYATPIE